MAYAAASVSSVMQSLESLLNFARRTLQIRKFRIERFTEKARAVARLLEEFSSSSQPSYRALSLMQLVESRGISEELAFDIYVITPSMVQSIGRISEESEDAEDVLEDVLITLREIGLFELELQEFRVKLPEILNETELADLKDFLNLVSLTDYFLSEITKLKLEMTFVHEEAVKIKGLCQDLSFLMAFLSDTANLYRNDGEVKILEKCISVMARRAEDFFEEKLLDITVQSKLDSLILEPLGSLEIPSIINTAMGEIFHKENGILPLLLSKFQEIESLKEKVKTVYDKTPDIENLQSSSISARVSKPPLVKEDMVVGLDDITNELLERLTGVGQTSGLAIVTIVGMGGIGKTTLARKVFDHPYAVYHFYCRAWVSVSQVYQVRDLLLRLLCSVTQPTDEIYKMSKEQLAEYLYKRLKGQRYLVVMDDIWSSKVWDDVRRIFPDDRNGGRILLTSRLKSVAVYVNPKSPPYCMSLLGIDESWKLLEQKVFGKGGCPLELVEYGKHIVKECQGLPLAIVVVAGYLSQIKRRRECWKDAAASVSSIVITDPENYLEILELSYNRLPNNLKACFLYMGAFPEDCEIDVQKLINLWIAEGLLHFRSSKSLEEVGEDCLNDLVDRGLVLVGKRSFNGKIKTCCLHDLLRELCLRESQKENFMHVIKRDSHGFPADITDKRLLSFHMELDGDVHLIPSLPLVRSFLCFSVGCFFSADIFLLHLHFKLLRVLDIGFLRFDHFPEQILKLVLLRYLELHLSYMFPEQLLVFSSLQTLVIHGEQEWITEHHGRRSLQLYAPRLRHFHIITRRHSRDPFLPSVLMLSRKGFQFAPQLQTLSTFPFSRCKREIFDVMPQLKKLGICETNADYQSRSFMFLSSLVYLKQLEILKCSFYMQNTVERRNLICGAFPSSIRQLTLSWSRLPWEEMVSISSLPNLEVLKLKNYAFQGAKWTPTEDGFCRLKYLLIEKTDLEDWEASRIHFPSLQRLIFRSCTVLKEIPFGVWEIPTLELIELHYCGKSAELSAEEIRAQTDGVVEVRIQS